MIYTLYGGIEMHQKDIRIYFVHPEMKKGKLESVEKMIPLDRERFHFIWDEHKPQYIIGGEKIYVDRHMRKEYLELVRKNPDAVTIFFAGEAIACDFNIFDYAVVFDKDLFFQDRVFRHPTYTFFSKSIFCKDNDISLEDAREEYRRRKFCNFIYSNGDAHYKRDELFYAISKYKRVDSLGKHLNNTGCKSTRDRSDWNKISINDKSNYRFSIAAENAVFYGYTSEKILTSFQAHSIPIYFGDPSVESEFNCNSFINVNKYESEKELLQVIEEIDNDEELWCRMVVAPWRTTEQVIRQKQEYIEYKKFINHIFEQNIKDAKRIGQGTWPSSYNRFFVSARPVRKITIKKVIQRIKDI